MSIRSANWSRETKMEKSGLWTRRSRVEHSRSLQSRPADGGTCSIMSVSQLCHLMLTAYLVLQTGGLHRSAGEHGVLQGSNEGEQTWGGGRGRREAGGRDTGAGRRKICNKVTMERNEPHNKHSPRA